MQRRVKRILIHPLAPMVIALTVAVIAGALVLGFAPRKVRPHLFWYDVPILAPFVAFVFERARAHWQGGAPPIILDLVFVGIALTRAALPIPWYSGHAFFLTYAGLTSTTWFVRFAALVVLLEVAWFKIVIWNFDPTLLGGIALGACGALYVRKRARLFRRKKQAQLDYAAVDETI